MGRRIVPGAPSHPVEDLTLEIRGHNMPTYYGNYGNKTNKKGIINPTSTDAIVTSEIFISRTAQDTASLIICIQRNEGEKYSIRNKVMRSLTS